MLKQIPAIISPDLLHVMASMGHGDELALVDANFPAAALAQRLVMLPGIAVPTALQAILSLLPIDNFVPEPGWTMQVVGDVEGSLPVIEEMRSVLHEHDSRPLASLERHAFYARARTAFAIVQTGELRKYGNIILKKGVIAVD
jgi:L-fucose mutarotase